MCLFILFSVGYVILNLNKKFKLLVIHHCFLSENLRDVSYPNRRSSISAYLLKAPVFTGTFSFPSNSFVNLYKNQLSPFNKWIELPEMNKGFLN